MYTAFCLAAKSEDYRGTDGFPTEEAAWEHVFSKMCRWCKQERELALAGKDFDPPDPHCPPSDWPPCTSEWAVGPTKEMNKANDIGEVFEAAGYRKA